MATKSPNSTGSHDMIKAAYQAVKDAVAADCASNATRDKIRKMSMLSVQFLDDYCAAIDLTSLVAGKSYFSYEKKGGNAVISRPANRAYFVKKPSDLETLWNKWVGDDDMDKGDFARFSYTVALAPCLAMELFDRNNKKGPATYFECFIGHLFAQQFAINPVKKATLPLPSANKTVRLTMDFIFQMKDPKPNVHLAVKMSTRERIVQAWAHQRLLDAAYGDGAYLGVMALFTETKLDLRKREVVEICVPDQWLAYQGLLATMDRIYYFDVPTRYKELAEKYPSLISVEQFGVFFEDRHRFLPDPDAE